MKKISKKASGLGLCSGGLDSILSAQILLEQGVAVEWITFETPFFSAEKAKKAAEKSGIPIHVHNITDIYLPMLKNPPGGYGKNMNPCMDCHTLMFKIAGQKMADDGLTNCFAGMEGDVLPHIAEIRRDQGELFCTERARRFRRQ